MSLLNSPMLNPATEVGVRVCHTLAVSGPSSLSVIRFPVATTSTFFGVGTSYGMRVVPKRSAHIRVPALPLHQIVITIPHIQHSILARIRRRDLNRLIPPSTASVRTTAKSASRSLSAWIKSRASPPGPQTPLTRRVGNSVSGDLHSHYCTAITALTTVPVILPFFSIVTSMVCCGIGK